MKNIFAIALLIFLPCAALAETYTNKIVDGVEVPLTKAEVKEFKDREAADEIRKEETEKADAVAAVDVQLQEIDNKKVRALTDAVLTGDKSKLQALEEQAVALRKQRADLVGQ